MRSSIVLALTGLLSLAAAKPQFLWLNKKLDYIPLDTTRAVQSGDELFRKSCPEEISPRLRVTPRLLNSSYDSIHTQAFDRKQIYASSSSFVRGVIEAWSQHQHLSLRPDEVWFEILAQLNFYMTKNAETVRNLFVDHEGKEEIKVYYQPDVTSDSLVQSFARNLKDRVKTDWLAEWVKPGFSTSSPEDDLTANIYMMGLMQTFFDFSGASLCGLPSIKLKGERQDWVNLLGKLEHLREFGSEPTEYARVLQPILEGFVRTWDEPKSAATTEFWSNIVLGTQTAICGGTTRVNGWITGFYFWKPKGDLFVTPEQRERLPGGSRLGNVKYVAVKIDQLPISYAKVPVKLENYPGLPGQQTAYLLAGNIGVFRTVNRAQTAVSAEPMSGWYMYGPVDPKESLKTNPGNMDELTHIEVQFGKCAARY
ncbi:hypothetical protein CDD81_8107 [Ophiocordyceps australis]|uniref:Uncharacterized protein n=1 Tax=Ophiocordyceps australis TaxID=1399860 RepID=A0A2C5Y1W4_9HYPO|nr:hypothetical protein CDD81_8107 [Ophiocordyceps australis]